LSETKKMFAVRFYNRLDQDDARRVHLQAHLDWLRDHEKVIFIGGSLRNTTDGRTVGGLWLVEAAHSGEVELLIESDPFSIHGVRDHHEVLQWTNALSGSKEIGVTAPPSQNHICLFVRTAVPSDTTEIAALVNKAYRPSNEAAGWTHESELVSGPRTSPAKVAELLVGNSRVLVLCRDDKIVACVQVELRGSAAYIGMLATDPSLQEQGLGKQMLAQAEHYATSHFEVLQLRMLVLSSRPELLAYYMRRGYKLTGESHDYPTEAGIGQPVVPDLNVLALVKKVSGTD
jgi:ribosomal protein S18 acetylase RimI-like enzyme/uncharacterized protein YciI